MFGEVPGRIFDFEWELALMEWVQKNLGKAGEFIAQIFSYAGSEIAVLLIFLILFFCYRKEVGKRVGVAVITAALWGPMIKNIVMRFRPYMAHPDRIKCLQLVEADADPLDVMQQGYSFPSGHCAQSASTFAGMARIVRKRWALILAIILPLGIGVSRFAVGCHYPTDVLAGWTLGLLAVMITALLEKKIPSMHIRNLILLATTLPGLFFCTSADYFTGLGIMIGMNAAFPFEEKYVRFEDTRSPLAMLLRVLGGAAIYLLGNKLLKLPFDAAFLNNGTMGANLIRTGRYALLVFLIAGVFPLCFKRFERKHEQDLPAGE